MIEKMLKGLFDTGSSEWIRKNDLMSNDHTSLNI